MSHEKYQIEECDSEEFSWMDRNALHKYFTDHPVPDWTLDVNDPRDGKLVRLNGNRKGKPYLLTVEYTGFESEIEVSHYAVQPVYDNVRNAIRRVDVLDHPCQLKQLLATL